MFDKKVFNFYSIVVGASFIISGVGKLLDTTAFSALLYQYGFGRLMVLSPLIVVAEVLLGLMLVLLIKPKRYAAFSFILLLIFTLAFAYGHFKNGVNDCGCFGTLQHTNIAPVYSFLRNFILMGMALIVWIGYPSEAGAAPRWKKPVIFMALGISAFIAGLTFKMPGFLQTTPTTSKFNFQDQNVKNTVLNKYINTSPDSTYLVFCFSYTCPHCLNSIANLRQFKDGNMVDRLIAFGTGNDSSKRAFTQNFKPDFYVKDLQPFEMLRFTDLFPTAFYIKHDTVKAVIQGELPSPVVFKSQFTAYRLK